MRKIHEFLDDLDIQNINIRVDEENMTKEEKSRIIEQTLNKAGLTNNKAKNKRFILPLAATLTLMLSFAVVFAQGGLSNIYNSIFGENIKYINDMGTVIDESYIENGIKLNVASMVGDENSFYIVFELIKENGDSFKDSDYIYFEDFHLNFSGSGGYTWYEIEDDNENDNKATFILSGNTEKKTVGDKLTLQMKDFVEYNIKEYNNFDVYEFLSNNNEFINQELEGNIQKLPIDINENASQEEIDKINEIYNQTPDKILPIKSSIITINEGNKEIYIDNLGFAEDKLCIRLVMTDSENYSFGDLLFVNKNNKEEKFCEYSFTEEKEEVEYLYYIFDIKDMEELKNYELKYNMINKINTTKGEWTVTFKADYKNTTDTINVNKKAKIQDKRYTVKNIKLSPISLNVKLINNLLDYKENTNHDFFDEVSVVMEDGSLVEVSSRGSSTNSLTSTINLLFNQPIDIKQIAIVKIGDLEIEIDNK